MSILIACCLAVLMVSWLVRWRRKMKLPGPLGWPLLGNVGQLDKERPDKTMKEWAQQYGPVYEIHMFTTPWVIVSGYNELHDMLVTRGHAFAGRDMTFVRQMFFHSGHDVLHSDARQAHWQPLKKAAYRALKQTGDEVNVVEHILADMASEFVDKVASYQGGEVDMQDDVYNFVLKATMTMITGTKPHEDNAELHDIKRLDQQVQARLATTKSVELNYMPWLRHFGHPMYTKLLDLCQLRDSLWQRLWGASQETYNSQVGTSPCLMHAIGQLMDAKSPFHDPSISITEARGLFIDIIIAGVLTTSSSIYALINILLHHQHVVRHIQQEVDKVTQGERPPAIGDREAMPYTMASIYELLRYTSIVPTLPHKTVEDVQLGAHTIPAGTTVLPMFYTMHHDEHLWHEPYVFQPERFLNTDGTLLPPDHPHRKHLLQFGAGVRVCVGEVFALKRLFLFTAYMLQAFDICQGHQLISCDSRSYLFGTIMKQPSFTVTLLPRK